MKTRSKSKIQKDNIYDFKSVLDHYGIQYRFDLYSNDIIQFKYMQAEYAIYIDDFHDFVLVDNTEEPEILMALDNSNELIIIIECGGLKQYFK